MEFHNKKASSYPYEYFSGANITVALNDYDMFECAGISYNMMDSQQPIFGYCSRMFDAVAPGQLIIQGSFVTNFIYPNYVYDVITKGIAASIPNAPINPAVKKNQLSGPEFVQSLDKAKQDKDWDLYDRLIAERKQLFKGGTDTINHNVGDIVTMAKNPSTAGPFDIKITFGGTSMTDKKAVHTVTLWSAFIIGRASTIQIDESVILEEYSFFARAISTQSRGS